MIKYILDDDMYRLGKFNNETEEFGTVKSTCTRITGLYIIPENGVFNGSNVNKGDVIMVLYGVENTSENEIIVVTDDKLKDYYRRLIEHQKQLLSKGCCECDCDCAEPF